MRLLLVGCALLAGASSVAYAQVTLEQLLQSDRAEFASEAPSFYKALRKQTDPQTLPSSEAALRGRAKELLLNVDPSDLTLDEARTLGYFALPVLSLEERSLLDERLSAGEARMSSSSLEQLYSRLALESGLMDGYEYRARRKLLTAAWLEGRDLSTLSKSNLLALARLLAEGFTPENGFSVEWAGLVAAPRDGEYRFSISPHDMNVKQVEDWEDVENSCSVTLQIDESEVLAASPGQWKFEGEPVTLTAGEPATVRLRLRCHWTNDHMRMTPAILYWEGPGVPRSVVPESAFSVADASGSGLAVEYAWDEKSGDGTVQRNVTAKDPNVEFIWPQRLESGLRSEAVRHVAGQLVERWIQSDGDFVGDVARWPQVVSILTTTQLKQCLDALAAQPAQLDAISAARMERFLYGVRCGAEEAAVDIVGVWLCRRPYTPPVFAANPLEYFDLNREFFYRIAEFFVFEFPEGVLQLEDEYLVDGDGRCNANVATALAECYLVQGEIDKWVETLDGHLSNESMDAAIRFEWLMARSQAEEFRGAYADRYHRTSELFLAGQDWLDEAALLSDTTQQRERILREKLVRHAALGWWTEAERALEQARGEGGVLPEQIDLLEQSVGLARQRAVAQANLAAREADEAYANEIRRRRDRSAAAGDSVGVGRYEQVLSSFRDSEPRE